MDVKEMLYRLDEIRDRMHTVRNELRGLHKELEVLEEEEHDLDMLVKHDDTEE